LTSLRSIAALLLVASAFGQSAPKEKAAQLASFEVVWSTIRDRNPDPKLNGLDWQAIHDSFEARVRRAKSAEEVRGILREMTGKLELSHYSVIPAEAYSGTDAAAAEPVRGAPQSKAVEFGNLPKMRVEFESRTLDGGVGYIRFNEFLDPVSLMPKFEAALRDFAHAPGVILDLRGNRGGIGIMASGMAGYFIGDAGHKLGEMKMRDTTLQFNVFPRLNVFAGRLAILLDGGSASTTEILAQGLQDLKRARIFGTRSAGAALPSDIIRLPDGDGFQYPTASYISANGRVLEGNGVIPDVEVRDAGAVIDAAARWILQP
jgi:Peptidase family S41/Tricorn protease C1 domain